MTDNLTDKELTPEMESTENQIIENVEITNSEVEATPPEIADTKVEEADGDKSETTDEAPLENSEPVTEIVPVEVETIVVEVSEEAKPIAETTPTEETSTNEEAVAPAKEEKKPKEYHNPKFDKIFEDLKLVKENNGIIEVNVIERIRGGLRVRYEDMPMFLPASHFGIKRNPTEQAMKDAIGKSLPVHIHELQEDETKRKTVIVSRKKILEDKFWDSLKVGEIVEGPITSIASFGIFIDVYGVEGLVHVTRLSNTRIEDLQQTFKKGQIMKALIVDVSKERKRIGLSTKELEESPWKGLTSDIKPGTIVKGTLKRLTEFGAYFEIKQGVDGLVRSNELSWTLRYKNPGELLNINDEKELYVISVNEDKKSIALSLKRTTESPWSQIAEKYPLKTVVKGVIKQLSDQGAIININDEVDGFMPRSKMRFLPKGASNVGETVEVQIDSIDIDKESMIVVPPFEEKPEFKPREKERPRSDSSSKVKKESEVPSNIAASDSSAFTLQDLLSESMKKNLMKG